MQVHGELPEGVEVGDAWALRAAGNPTNWIVGETASIPSTSLRYIRQGGTDGPEQVSGVSMKWFVHDPSDPVAWGENKPLSEGRTLSILAEGGPFEATFERAGRRCRVVLEKSGEYAAWGAGVMHTWKPLARSTVVTLRWKPEETKTIAARTGATG